jgi:hypothetical protein
MRVESEEPLHNHLEERSAHSMARHHRFHWPSGGQLPRSHERIATERPRNMATPVLGALILNFFQCSREPHFPEPHLDV